MALISQVLSATQIKPRLLSEVLLRIRQVEHNGCPGLLKQVFTKYREEAALMVQNLKLCFELERWNEAADLTHELERLACTIGADGFKRTCHHFRLKQQNGLSGYDLKLERESLLAAFEGSLHAITEAEEYFNLNSPAA